MSKSSFDDWMLSKNPKYRPTDDTVEFRKLRECWHTAQNTVGKLEDTCRKCGGAMKPGKAIAQTWTGSPDFPGDNHCVTLSPGGAGKLIDCIKCEKCGHSVRN